MRPVGCRSDDLLGGPIRVSRSRLKFKVSRLARTPGICETGPGGDREELPRGRCAADQVRQGLDPRAEPQTSKRMRSRAASRTHRQDQRNCGPTTHRGAFSDSASCSFRRLGPTAHRGDWCRSRQRSVAYRVVPLPLVTVSSTVSHGQPARHESRDFPALPAR
jgi:hypothetical protein